MYAWTFESWLSLEQSVIGRGAWAGVAARWSD